MSTFRRCVVMSMAGERRWSWSSTWRCFAYDPFSSVRMDGKSTRRRRSPGIESAASRRAPASSASSSSVAATTGGAALDGQRTDAPDGRIIYSETLPSGRYKNDTETLRIERELRRMEMAAARSRGETDTRFQQRVTDFRQIQNSDPLFKETGETQKLRIRFWQKQFEEENAGVELPYERTNVIYRAVPNWFVRGLLNIRDRGGAETMWWAFAVAALFIGAVAVYHFLAYVNDANAKPVHEIR